MFHDLHVGEPPAKLSDNAFGELYREVIDIDAEEPEQVWREWNRGSGRESEAFLELRYCDRCQSYIEGGGEAVTHAAQNHGYDAFTESGEPEYVRGERSMSVGDVVEIDGRYFMAVSIGWEEIELEGGIAGN